VSQAAALIERARLLDVALDDASAGRLLRLLDELDRWNAAYNLTSIRGREEMISQHLLDSLSIHAEVRGSRIADVGTGAGFPGLPLAIVDPDRRFTLIDSAGKKVRFVAHAARALGLGNIEAVHSRVEDLNPSPSFDTVTTRAFAALPELLAAVSTLCGPGSRVLAMKGRYPAAEIAAVQPPWRIVETRRLAVPGLDAERHLVIVEQGMS
jgi:16S rRNA (guanine527-N7)-methyltransferase